MQKIIGKLDGIRNIEEAGVLVFTPTFQIIPRKIWGLSYPGRISQQKERKAKNEKQQKDQL